MKAKGFAIFTRVTVRSVGSFAQVQQAWKSVPHGRGRFLVILACRGVILSRTC